MNSMKRIFLLLILVSALPLLFSGCKDNDLLRDMADLDKAYVPALVLTGDEDTTGQAVMAVKTLKLQWSVFKGRMSLRHKDWNDVMGEVEEMIMRADSLINAGDNLGAHHALEGIREVLFTHRKEAGIEYFPDYLTEFHGAMKRIVTLVQDKTPLMLAESEIEEIRGELPRAVALWEMTMKAEFDRKVFGFEDTKSAKLKYYFERESAALRSLERALAGGHRETIVKAARTIKPYYVKTFKLFGDFDSLL